MKPVYIVDIDGTVADISHRLHYIQRSPADWDKFFLACTDDAPIPEVINTVSRLKNSGAVIAMLSGRSELVRVQTIDWLLEHSCPCDLLYLRKAGDHRQDNVVKSEQLDELLSKLRPRESVVAVFEDRDQVVKMYRDRGLRVFQVANGNF